MIADIVERMSWEQRSAMGTEAEQKFISEVRRQNLTILVTSQHRDAPKSKLERHFPDLFILQAGVFVQVKNASNSYLYTTVIAEKDSINACIEMSRLGQQVWAMWMMPHKNFKGNTIRHLEMVGAISNTSREHGSGTPGNRYSKHSLKDLSAMLAQWAPSWKENPEIANLYPWWCNPNPGPCLYCKNTTYHEGDRSSRYICDKCGLYVADPNGTKFTAVTGKCRLSNDGHDCYHHPKTKQLVCRNCGEIVATPSVVRQRDTAALFAIE
jgi:ribosomal protein S27E